VHPHPRYEWLTYGQAAADRAVIASGLERLGVRPSERVGLYSVNCADWVLTEGALTRCGCVSVPLYDTLGPEAVQFICTHAELVAVACHASVLSTMMATLAACPTVKLVVVFGAKRGAPPPPPSPVSGVKVVTLDAVRSAGRAAPCPPHPPRASDVATICYTSGTTGNPKGVVLTHLNLVSNTAAMEEGLDEGVGDVHISYLPLAHIYERVIVYTCLHSGAAIGFFRGDVLGLLDDMAALRPTIFVSVPRLLNRIHDKVAAGLREGSFLKRQLFAMAYASKLKSLQEGRPVSAFWDKLVFSKLRDKLGGRVRLMSSGSAPISAEVLEFLRVCFGGVVFEGYGMTESACVISKSDAGDMTTGHVGPPASCSEIKLVDVPEMQYLSTDLPTPRGEICVRGPSIFQGYFKDPVQTAEVLDSEGWLHTGDIGTWLPGGRLKIIDRKKNIFKLAQGEYVAPEKIENVYVRAPLVAACFVYGDSLAPALVSVVVPDEEALHAWAKENGHPQAGNTKALCADPKVAAAVLAQMKAAASKAGLRSFEQAKAVHLHPEAWTVEGGLITPSFKLKRPQARAFFQSAIDAMYALLAAKGEL